jgi:hypothetical protein
MSNIAAVKAEVQRLLMEDLKLNAVKLTPSGGFSFRVDSAEVFIDVIARGENAEQDTIVVIYAPVGIEVPMTPELFEYVALNSGNWFFGHLTVRPDKDSAGRCYVEMSHNLLGDFMDPPEFKAALVGLASSAEAIDDEIVARFGGRRAHEDAAPAR